MRIRLNCRELAQWRLASQWLLSWAFASPPRSGLAWLCFLFPLIEPDGRISRIRLSEKTHAVLGDAVPETDMLASAATSRASGCGSFPLCMATPFPNSRTFGFAESVIVSTSDQRRFISWPIVDSSGKA